MPRAVRTITDIKSEARKHTAVALRTLLHIAACKKAPPAARATAAQALLDRGWGKPAQTIAGDGDNPVKIVIVSGVPGDEEEGIQEWAARTPAPS